MLYTYEEDEKRRDVQLEELKIKIQSLINKISNEIQKICNIGVKENESN